jgi:hypothetical protein
MENSEREQQRLADSDRPWKRWGPYLSERAWGTVREDYSEHGEAWDFFSHDHARSRAYRWNEDGLGGICDDGQRLCFAWAFWNGRDPILKERIFGLTGPEGNHGEDAKEHWWYVDSTPTHSWMRWRFFYPQGAFPYDHLVAENRSRGREDPEFELLDTGIFDGDCYWDITADYAKADVDDLCIRLTVRNAGPEEATLHVLPTLWFRNTWSWGRGESKPGLHAKDGAILAAHAELGRFHLSSSGEGDVLVCENETNTARLWGAHDSPAYPKDGIGDHVIFGADTVNPAGTGTKASLWHRLTVPAGQQAELRLRLAPEGGDLGRGFARVLSTRAAEANDFYAGLLGHLDSEGQLIARQALGGMMWGKQYFHYDVEHWLDGDPVGPSPPDGRRIGRNSRWRHLNNADVISVCDAWEYPWFATWDLAFQAVALAHADAAFAKDQLLLMCREWYMHPNGQLPAYEWAFGDVNPPVHAWAALRVAEIDAHRTGHRDLEFLERIFHKLLLNFTWWVNRKDAGGDNVFDGGFLGMDNVGPLDRSAPLPVEGRLEQSDATGWMALYCLNMLELALLLTERSGAYEDMCTKFLEHFAYIATAIHERGLWEDEDGFYYDVLRMGADRIPLRVRSMVGLLPLCAVTTIGPSTLERLPRFAAHLAWFIEHKPHFASHIDQRHTHGGGEGRLLAIVGPERLDRILDRLLDDSELLSPGGIRSVSAHHRDHPFTIELGGMSLGVDYVPGESRTGIFGGNSNWRGPVWFPVNALVIEALRAYGRFFGDDREVEHPRGSGQLHTLREVADDLSDRLIWLFREGPDGRRPVHGHQERFAEDPAWHDLIPFHEYFHGDTGQGLGASHQTGWTGLVADQILRREPAWRTASTSS